jgi:signal transduction histidine kinase
MITNELPGLGSGMPNQVGGDLLHTMSDFKLSRVRTELQMLLIVITLPPHPVETDGQSAGHRHLSDGPLTTLAQMDVATSPVGIVANGSLGGLGHITQQTLGFYRDNSQPVVRVVADVIQDVLTIYERKCQYKALNIEQRIEPNLTLTAVQGELKQILSNLIANAIDASQEGGKIVICARTSHHFPSGGSGVRITIADNGVGISDENKQNLFTPFFTTKSAVGTGLGLWITKDLLEKRGGRIRFRSTDSGRSGTVMTIYLPSV